MTELTTHVETSFQSIAESLIQEGFKWVPGQKPVFKSTILIKEHEFEIELSEIDITFLTLPVATLTKRPACLPRHLPHLEKNNTLCYLNRLGIYLDPFQPGNTIKFIVRAIRNLLAIYTDPKTMRQEYAAEFCSYWHPSTLAFLITGNSNGVATRFQRKNASGNTEAELVIASDKDAVSTWCNLRNIIPSEQKIEGEAVILNIENPSFNLNDEWPPKSFADFVAWLQKAHPDIEHKLLQSLCDMTKNSHRILVVLNSSTSGPFGVDVQFDKSISQVSARFSSGSKHNNKGIRRSQHKLSQFRISLTSRSMVKTFTRLFIKDARTDFILERNLRMNPLSNLKIAILGCGTLGGYVAQLLVKAGAGNGDKSDLSLFDSDVLQPSNLGRHILCVGYLNEQKSHALADYLKKQVHFQLRIKGRSNIRPQEFSVLKHYDLILDLTGDETFSTLLSYHFNQLPSDSNSPTPKILHAWVDAGGLAVRALLDDGEGACYRCLKIDNGFGRLEERFPLWKSDPGDHSNMITQRCGESYFPFSAGVSNAAAGMVQQMALEATNYATAFRFKQIAFSPDIRLMKDANPKRLEQCPCCRRS